MSSWLGQFHDFTKKYDPLGHELVNGMWKSSTGIVNESSRAMQSLGEKWGINTKIPEYGKNLSQKDKESFNRWGENTIGAAGAVIGGMYAAGGEGAAAGGGAVEGGGAAGGLGAGNGAFLGEGVPSGIGAWDGAAGGSGLGFNPNGMPEGSSLASDFPTQGMGKGGMGNIGSMFGQGNGQSQQSGGQNQALAQQLKDRMDQQAMLDQQAAVKEKQPGSDFTNQSTIPLTPEQQQQMALLLQQRTAAGQGYA
jgi:hypothetical protein